MAISFGIDLAGYSSGKTGVAAVLKESTDVHIFIAKKLAPFSVRIKGHQKIETVVAEEARIIGNMLKKGPVLVDAPIDLQNLDDLGKLKPSRIWQLTKRPVDQALDGLAPSADKIGSPAARIRFIKKS